MISTWDILARSYAASACEQAADALRLWHAARRYAVNHGYRPPRRWWYDAGVAEAMGAARAWRTAARIAGWTGPVTRARVEAEVAS